MKCLVTPAMKRTAINHLNLNPSLSQCLLSQRSPAMELLRCLVILATVPLNLQRTSINLILIRPTMDLSHLIRHSLMDSVVISPSNKGISHSKDISSRDISNKVIGILKDISNKVISNLKDISNKVISNLKDISHNKDISSNKDISHNKDTSNKDMSSRVK